MEVPQKSENIMISHICRIQKILLLNVYIKHKQTCRQRKQICGGRGRDRLKVWD